MRWDGCRPPQTASQCAKKAVFQPPSGGDGKLKDTMTGVDLAKNVFVLHGASLTGQLKFRKKLSRIQFRKFMRVLSRLFRRLFLTALADVFAHRKLRFSNELNHLNDDEALTRHRACSPRGMVCCSKAPFGGLDQVLAYHGRYTIVLLSPTAAASRPMTTMLPSDGRTTVAMVATVRRSCALTHTSSSGVFFCTCSLTASTACATSAFSPIASDGIVSVSVGSSSTNHHQQAGSRRPANHSTGSPTNALTAGVPCTGQGSLLRLFRRPGHHPSGAIHHELRQSAPPPICPQNQAPRQRATSLGPGHTERPTVYIESAKIAVDRPASCSRRSPDQAETW